MNARLPCGGLGIGARTSSPSSGREGPGDMQVKEGEGCPPIRHLTPSSPALEAWSHPRTPSTWGSPATGKGTLDSGLWQIWVMDKMVLGLSLPEKKQDHEMLLKPVW